MSAEESSVIGRFSRSPLVAVALVGAFPVVFLWADNLEDDISLPDVSVTLVWSVGVSLMVYAFARLALRDRAKAGILTLLLQAIAFTFGYVVEAGAVRSGSPREGLLIVAFLVAGGAGIWAATQRTRGDLVFRLVVPTMAVLIVANMGRVVVQGEVIPREVPSAAFDAATLGLGSAGSDSTRDVYYLIFDRYAGYRTLEDLYGFDNSGFLGSLRARGFAVVDDALANYPQTTHSLASSLNMTYLDDLADEVGEDATDWDPLYASLRDTTVGRAFRALGYETVQVGAWWGPTAVDTSADQNYIFFERGEFSEAFLRSTIIPPLAERLPVVNAKNWYERAHDRVGFQFDAVREIAADPVSTFTFAHFLLPHPPYVFSRDGTYRKPWDDAPIEERYVDQLVYTNTAIVDLVDLLLAGPEEEDPIIVIQSDEGPNAPGRDAGVPSVDWGEEPDSELGRKLRILNALYLPGRAGENVPEDMTPVNTFRFILARYFGGSADLLENRTWVYVDHGHPYRFEDVTDRLRA